MQDLWRIKDVVEWTTRYFQNRGLDGARLEAELLLAQVLKKDRVYLYTNYDRPLDKEEREEYKSYIRRRIQGEPIAYILGYKEFMSLSFQVSPAVLIPRPETEVLVEKALSIIEEESITEVCDVGTGSGAIAISLAHAVPHLHVHAVDVSEEALDVARKNAALNGVTVDWQKSDLLSGFKTDKPLDLITANLPYIPEAELQCLDPGVRDYEPRLALVAAGDGLDLYRDLLVQAQDFLAPGGRILLEIDPRQSEAARGITQGFTDLEIIPDLAGRDRVVFARRIR